MHIDWWTLALQTVNVLVLVWILARFFFRPVADIVEKRQGEANKLLADAAAARDEAAAARADADKSRAQIAAERDRLVAEARQSAQAEKENLRAQASQEITKLRGDAKAAIAQDRIAAQQAVLARASELAVDIAGRLLGRFPPTIALAAFLDGLCRELAAMSSEAKASLASATDQPVAIVTAAPLSEAETRQVQEALKQALGSVPPCEFRTDPAVIAGIELLGRHIIVRNSWRADLDRICKELGGDEHTR